MPDGSTAEKMFEYLQQIDERIYARYLTVETNVKSASNSFYDSFLDLQEHFLKIIIEENSIAVSQRESCGGLLKLPEVKELFLEKYGVNSYAYDKMGDYTKKTNDHKHRKEKNIQVDTIVSYMRVFYDVSSCVAKAKGISAGRFDGEYFRDIFGSMAKIDQRLSDLEEEHQKILQAFERLSEEKQNAQPPRTENTQNSTRTGNKTNSAQTIKNFISRAEKKYNWFGTKEQFARSKIILVCIQAALIAVGLLSTIITSASLKLYSTFTLFENIVALQTCFLLVYTLKSEKHYHDFNLAKYNSDIFVRDSDGIWRDTNKEKKRYKWLRRISYVSVICNVICIWTMGAGAVRIAATIFELAFLALTIASVFVRIDHYCMYDALFISGYNASRTEKVTIVHDRMQNKLFTFEEYSEKFSDFI